MKNYFKQLYQPKNTYQRVLSGLGILSLVIAAGSIVHFLLLVELLLGVQLYFELIPVFIAIALVSVSAALMTRKTFLDQLNLFRGLLICLALICLLLSSIV